MADRIFASALLLVAIGYTLIAFTLIEAPFQYDPLGPETWPRILGVVAIACLIPLIVRPDIARLSLPLPTWGRLGVLVVLLFAYAYLFQPAGFVIATFLFCTALSLMLGSRLVGALAFGAATGVFGYLLCTIVLELNLPAGLLSNLS